MNFHKRVIATMALALFLAACNKVEVASTVPIEAQLEAPVIPQDQRVTVHKIQQVTGGTQLRGRPAIAILTGPSQDNVFFLILGRSNIKPGYSVESSRSNHPEIALSAAWGGEVYKESAYHLSYASVTVRSVTPTEAVLEVAGILVEPKTGALLTLERSTLSIRGDDLKALMAES